MGDKDPNLAMIVFLKGNLVMIVVITMKNRFKCHKKQQQRNNAVVSQQGERKNAEIKTGKKGEQHILKHMV